MAKKEEKKFIEEQIPVQDRPNTAFQSSGVSGGFRGFPKPLKPTKSFLQKQAAKEKIKKEVSSAKFGTPTRFLKTAEKFGTTPTSKRSTLDTGKIKGKKPKTGKPTIPPRQLAAQRRTQTINQQVKNATEQFPNPTGATLKKGEAFVVGSTVITPTTAGTLVKLEPSLLPDYQLNTIKVLPDEKDELQIQKVIEQEQPLTPEEISDLAVKTKAIPKTQPVTEPKIEPAKTPTVIPIPTTTPTPAPKTKPLEETLIGTEEDTQLEEPELDEVELTDPIIEIAEPEIIEPELPTPQVIDEPEIDVAPNPTTLDNPATLENPLTEFENEFSTQTVTEPFTEPATEPTPQPLEEPLKTPTKVETKVSTEVDDFGTVITKKPSATRSNKQDKKKKEKKTPKAIIPKKKKASKNKFKVKKGLKPTVTNFKTRKNSFQSNNVTGDIFKAPKGTQFDTNSGFREDSFKGIKFADKKLKFKNRKDVLVAAEKKGLI